MILLLFVLWLVFNGKVTPEILLFDVAVTALIYGFMIRFMDYSWKKERMVYRLLPLGLKYLVILIWEIIKANWVMLGVTASDKYELEPVVVRFVPDLKTEAARVILANSITLTPGTYTVGIGDGELRVHCLDRDFSVELESSVFVKQLQRIEAVVGGAESGAQGRKKEKAAGAAGKQEGKRNDR